MSVTVMSSGYHHPVMHVTMTSRGLLGLWTAGFVTFTTPVPPTWLIIFILRILLFCELDGEFCYHEAFEAQKRVVTRCRGQHRQHSEPGSTLTSQVQYRALAIGLWRIISAMQHTSEHNTCSVEICLNTLLCCMCITRCWQQLSLCDCAVHFWYSQAPKT